MWTAAPVDVTKWISAYSDAMLHNVMTVGDRAAAVLGATDLIAQSVSVVVDHVTAEPEQGLSFIRDDLATWCVSYILSAIF